MSPTADSATLVIDGVDCVGEFTEVQIGTPRLTYEALTDTGILRFLGPLGFQITVINPGARIQALVDGGHAVHHLTVTVDGMSLTNLVQFHRQWEVGGVPRAFGCLARDCGSEAQWVAAPATGQQAGV